MYIRVWTRVMIIHVHKRSDLCAQHKVSSTNLTKNVIITRGGGGRRRTRTPPTITRRNNSTRRQRKSFFFSSPTISPNVIVIGEIFKCSSVTDVRSRKRTKKKKTDFGARTYTTAVALSLRFVIPRWKYQKAKKKQKKK